MIDFINRLELRMRRAQLRSRLSTLYVAQLRGTTAEQVAALVKVRAMRGLVEELEWFVGEENK